MRPKQPYTYIAGPFFSEKQIEFVAEIEDALSECAFNYYSPRSEGTLLAQTEEEKQANKKRIYDTNVERIQGADTILAIIDDRDVGTIWEMGYATALGKRVITISNLSYGLNVMLAESVQAHVLSVEDALAAIVDPSYQGELKGMKGIY